MIGVIGYPDGHFFAAFEHRAFDEEGLEFDRMKLTVFCSDRLFPKVSDVEMINLPVEEHSEGYLIPCLVVVEIDVAGIEDGAQHVLDTVGYLENALAGDRRVGGLDESDILVGLIPPLVDRPDKFIRLRCGGIVIR